jgi:hypothetical protein
MEVYVTQAASMQSRAVVSVYSSRLGMCNPVQSEVYFKV